MTDATADKVLATPPGAPKDAENSMIVRVAKEAKVSPFRQFAEMMSLRSGENRLTSQEYYDFQVYRRELSKAEKKEFVGEQGSFRLNLKLAPPNVTHMRGFLGDKVAYTALLAHLGLPTTTTQAFFSEHRNVGTIRTLRSEDDLRRFLTAEAEFPLFGKPFDGFQALGTVGISGVDAAAGQVRLASGQAVDLQAFTHEIITGHREGYLFQSAVQQHPDLVARVGPAVATVRVVTVVEQDVPKVLYSLWKIPSPSAMSDNFWQQGSMICLVDSESGEVQTCRRGTGPDTEWLDTHPESGAQITGYRLPEWRSVTDLAVAAHAMFPVNGVLGWDIAIGPEGALVIECNPNTGHMLYQLASGRGVLNTDFRPAFDRVIARNGRMVAEFEAAQKARRSR